MDGFILRKVGGNNFLLDTKAVSEPYRDPLCINDMGALIYTYLEQGKSIETVIETLSKEYGVSDWEIAQDVTLFLEELRKFGVQL